MQIVKEFGTWILELQKLAAELINMALIVFGYNWLSLETTPWVSDKEGSYVLVHFTGDLYSMGVYLWVYGSQKLEDATLFALTHR